VPSGRRSGKSSPDIIGGVAARDAASAASPGHADAAALKRIGIEPAHAGRRHRLDGRHAHDLGPSRPPGRAPGGTASVRGLAVPA